jgi:hypothetical protein
MNANREIIGYLCYLFEHYADCNVENCSTCAQVQDVCESVRQRIFACDSKEVERPQIAAAA